MAIVRETLIMADREIIITSQRSWKRSFRGHLIITPSLGHNIYYVLSASPLRVSKSWELLVKKLNINLEFWLIVNCHISINMYLWSWLLCILTSEWVLCTPFASWNHLFLRKNKFFHPFPSLTEKKEEKRKESVKITQKTFVFTSKH